MLTWSSSGFIHLLIMKHLHYKSCELIVFRGCMTAWNDKGEHLQAHTGKQNRSLPCSTEIQVPIVSINLIVSSLIIINYITTIVQGYWKYLTRLHDVVLLLLFSCFWSGFLSLGCFWRMTIPQALCRKLSKQMHRNPFPKSSHLPFSHQVC